MWLLLTHVLVTVWAVVTVQDRYRWRDLLVATMLMAAASVHLVCTRVPEERRRAADRRGEHVDQTSIWVFTAAVLLPVPLVLAVVGAVRWQRWRIARKPAFRFLFTSMAIAASALGVHTVAEATDLRSWLTGLRGWPTQPTSMLTAAAALAAAVAVYFLAQVVILGVARGLATGAWLPPELLGDRHTNAFILVTLAIAVCATVLLALSPALALVMIPVAVRSTRTEQHLAQARAESEQLRTDALHDALTGLLNRRGFDPAAALALVTDQSQRRATGLLMLDLDHFKQVNDSLGHVGGDAVLIAFATTVRGQTRDQDLVCRWGGEEIAVLLPGADRAEASGMAERIRAAVATMTVPISRPAGGSPLVLGAGGQGGCTVSIGVAASPIHGGDLTQLQQVADTALYEAKNAGRDRVVEAPAPDPRLGKARMGQPR